MAQHDDLRILHWNLPPDINQCLLKRNGLRTPLQSASNYAGEF
jgi:hypothetical protein